MQFLRSLQGFSMMSDADLEQLARYCRHAQIESGEYISVEGSEESLYGFIVVSGRLAMIKSSLSGKELIVELLAPGDVFGVLLMLSAERHVAQLSARAQSRSHVLWVPLRSLLPILRSRPEIYNEFVTQLLKTLHSSYRLARGLAHDRVSVRIAAILTTLALKFSRPPPSVQDHTIDITRQQIADLTGTSAESAIRVTGAMQRKGLIDISRPGVVRVLDIIGLQHLSESE